MAFDWSRRLRSLATLILQTWRRLESVSVEREVGQVYLISLFEFRCHLTGRSWSDFATLSSRTVELFSATCGH